MERAPEEAVGAPALGLAMGRRHSGNEVGYTRAYMTLYDLSCMTMCMTRYAVA